MNRRTETQSVETHADPADVLAVLADPQRIPAWAPTFADTITVGAQSGWRATKDDRPFNLRVVTQHDAGTVDYLREVAPGREGGLHPSPSPWPDPDCRSTACESWWVDTKDGSWHRDPRRGGHAAVAGVQAAANASGERNPSEECRCSAL